MATILVVTAVMVAVMVVCYVLGYWVFGPMSYGFRPFVSPKKAAQHPEKYRRR